jgi:hypothetical protein
MMKAIFATLALVAFFCSSTVMAAPSDASKSASASKFRNQGKVIEVLDTAMYTYLQVEAPKGPVWIAATKVKLAKGDLVGYGAGQMMSNFHSKSLNRTFEAIIFTDKVTVIK